MAIPKQIEPYSKTEFYIVWNNGDSFSLPYREVRFYCPCAQCVDEFTGKRTISKEALPEDIRPLSLSLVGKYAVQINWSDYHKTGIYHYDRLLEMCIKYGQKIQKILISPA